MKRVIATYLAETPFTLERAAEAIAGEQSTGTFTAVPGETTALKERFGARIERVVALEQVRQPSLPGAAIPPGHNDVYTRGEIVVSFPLHNFGPSIPNLMACVAGNLYELRELSGLRLLDLELPEEFAAAYPGPRFGIEGTRRLTGVRGRPVIGTIIKPSVGLGPAELEALVYALATSGLDFIKDDELNADPPYCPLPVKVAAVSRAIERAAEATGRRIMYAYNITGDIEALKRNHDTVVRAGGNCVMVSVNSVGLAGLAYLNTFSEVPIHGHRNQWGMLTRHGQLGMDFQVYQKLCRLAGADHLHVNGLGSKFYESDDSVVASVRACMQPLLGGYATMPVLSSGQWAGTAEITYARTNTVDVMHLAGGGILAHPDGPSAGVESLKQGWEAAMLGIPAETYAESRAELRRAFDKFKRKEAAR
ncbi:ribulose-bisphosphate carboxylase large subunit family protein [Cohnella hongkongensis]|uniref:Ribulose-bisphosphate carboxylase large subunit family protein n=1 Tax=Cohnella hongkongensis TaxID=178337 RepID=A0ABV9FIH1_9BACL